MIEALCLELEGVLLDTRAAREAAARLRPAADAPGLDATDHALAELRAERELEARLRSAMTLVPGAREALAALAARLRLGVVTRLSRPLAEQALALAGLEAHVAVLLAAGDPGRRPAGPAQWQAAAARLARLRPAAAGPAVVAALVGDVAGARAARAAGLRTIFVGSLDAPEDAGAADARLASLSGLTPLALAAALDLPLVPPERPA